MVREARGLPRLELPKHAARCAEVTGVTSDWNRMRWIVENGVPHAEAGGPWPFLGNRIQRWSKGARESANNPWLSDEERSPHRSPSFECAGHGKHGNPVSYRYIRHRATCPYGISRIYDEAEDVDLSCADLSGSDLTGMRLVNAILEGARLPGARLSSARFEAASLEGAVLDRAIFTGCCLDRVAIPRASLAESAFVQCALNGVDFRPALLGAPPGRRAAPEVPSPETGVSSADARRATDSALRSPDFPGSGPCLDCLFAA